MSKCKDHFNKASVEYRKNIRAILRLYGWNSAYRNKQVYGYSDKFLPNSYQYFETVCRQEGIKCSRAPSGWGIIVYLPNQLEPKKSGTEYKELSI